LRGRNAEQNHVDHFGYLGMSAGTLFSQTDDCTGCDNTIILFGETLYNEKWYPGYGYSIWIPGNGTCGLGCSTLWDGVSFPSVSLQADWRVHYKTYTVSWSCNLPPGNSESITASYSGAGFTPVSSPATVEGSCTPGSTGPANPPCNITPGDNFFSLVVGGIDSATYPPQQTNFTGPFGPYSTYDDGMGHKQTWTESIGGGTFDFVDELNAVVTRVQARSFPGTYVSAGIVPYDEYFDAGGGWTTFSDPISYPFYGDNGTGAGELASFWWWPSALFWLNSFAPASAAGCNGPLAGGDPGEKTYAARTKFKVGVGSTTPISYFIAKAHIVADPLDGTAQTLADATVTSTGTLNVGDELEIPFPTDDSDFVSTALDHGVNAGEDVLTFGMISFCILNETSAAWSTRTGIPIS
jgi:hypothetical protein